MSDRRRVDQPHDTIAIVTAQALSNPRETALMLSLNKDGETHIKDMLSGAQRLRGGVTTGLPLFFSINALKTAYLINELHGGTYYQPSKIGKAAVEGLQAYASIILPAHLERLTVLAQEAFPRGQTPAYLLRPVPETPINAGELAAEQLLVPTVYKSLRLQSYHPDVLRLMTVLSGGVVLSSHDVQHTVQTLKRENSGFVREIGEDRIKRALLILEAAELADSDLEDNAFFKLTTYGEEALKAFQAFKEPIYDAVEADMTQRRKLSEQGE